MLEMRPNCETCDKDLPDTESDATICSFECTFCISCATPVNHICPDCSDTLVTRPSRSEDKLDKYPASSKHVLKDRNLP